MERKKLRLRFIIGYFCFIVSILYIMQSKSAAAAQITPEPTGEPGITVPPDNELNPDESEAAQNEIHAFYPAYVSFSEQLQGYIDDVDSVSFAWGRFETYSPGTLNTVRGMNDNYSFYYPKDYIQPVTYAKSQGKSIQLSIYMSGKGSINSLPYEDTRFSMLQSIMQLMQTDITNGNGIYFDGVVIDFEGLRDTDSSNIPILYDGSPISTYYIEFLTDLKAALAPLGKKLYVAVNVRDYFNGFNYAEILKVADRVILMAHSYDPSSSVRITKNQALQYTGERTTKVNSLAPILRVKKALTDMQNAASDPADLKKVWLQICFDSAQWKFDAENSEGWASLPESTLSMSGKSSPSYKLLKNLVDNTQGYGENITYGYNDVLQSPFIQYFNTSDKSWNLILYEDSNSILAKIDLVNSFGMGGISLWSLANVPDYNDANGTAFHLDGWAAIVSKMKVVTQPPEIITYVEFTDPGIEQAVRQKLNRMTGGITSDDLLKIERLKLSGSIKSLDDLKMLVNLVSLDARNLGIADITALSGLVKLKWVNLNNNLISDVSPLKNLTKLEYLYLNYNNITSIKSLAGLTNLRELGLSSNQIAYLPDLYKLNKLIILNLTDNSIRYLKPLSGMSNLQALWLSKNQITSVEALANMTSLTTLHLKYNKITKVAPLKNLRNLQTLTLKGNPIKDYTSIKAIYSKRGFICDFKKL